MDDVVGCAAVRESEAGCACSGCVLHGPMGRRTRRAKAWLETVIRLSVLLPTSMAAVNAPSRTLGATTTAVAGSGTKTRLYDSDSARTGLFIAFSTPTQHPPRARCIALPAARGDDHDAVCTISGPRPRIIDPPPCRCPHQRASRQSRNPPSTLFAQDLNNSPSTPPLHRPRRLPTVPATTPAICSRRRRRARARGHRRIQRSRPARLTRPAMSETPPPLPT